MSNAGRILWPCFSLFRIHLQILPFQNKILIPQGDVLVHHTMAAENIKALKTQSGLNNNLTTHWLHRVRCIRTKHRLYRVTCQNNTLTLLGEVSEQHTDSTGWGVRTIHWLYRMRCQNNTLTIQGEVSEQHTDSTGWGVRTTHLL